MRKLAIALGLLIATLVAAALVLPRYVDWNAYRPEIAAAAKRLTGHEIAIDGEIRVTLLPKPVLTATRLRLLASDGLPDPLRLAALELRIAPAPLLTGKLRFERIRLVRPELTLVRTADGRRNWRWPAPSESAGEQARLTLDDVTVEHGSVTWRAGDGPERRLSDLDLVASARSLAGPLTAQGHFVAGGLPLAFALQLGHRGADGRLAVPKFNLRLADGAGSASFRGRYLGGADRGGLAGRLTLRSPDLAGTAARLGLPLALPRLPAVIEAKLQAGGDVVAFNDVSARLDEAELTGALHLTLGKNRRFEATVAAGRLDLDALLQAHAHAAAGPATGATAAAPMPWRLPPGIDGGIDLDIDGIALAGGVVRQARLTAELTRGVLRIDSAGALLPGGSKIGLRGDLVTLDGGPRFDGRLELHADNLRRLLGWLALDPEDLPADRLANLDLTSHLQVTPELLRADDAVLRFDGTRARGGLTYRLQGRPSFGLDLALDSIDLAEYLPRRSHLRRAQLALLQRFDSNLKLSAKHLDWNGRALGAGALDLGLVQGQLTVREARIADLAGARVTLHANASGFRDRPTYIGDVQLASADPAALLAALGLARAPDLPKLAPLSLDSRIEGEGTDLTLKVDGKLGPSPLRLDGSVKNLNAKPTLDLGVHVADLPLHQAAAVLGLRLPAAIDRAAPVSLDGRLAGLPSALQVSLAGQLAEAEVKTAGTLDLSADPPRYQLDVEAGAKAAAGLARRLGLAVPADGLNGGMALSAHVTGGPKALRLDIAKFTLGANRLAGQIAVTQGDARPRIDARLALGDIDLADWLPMLPAADAAKAATTDETTGLDLLRRYDGHLELTAEALAHGPVRLGRVTAELALEHGVLEIKRLQGRLFDGAATLQGRLVAGAPAVLDLRLALHDADLGRAAEAVLGSNALSGRLTVNGELQSLAADSAALSGNIDGSLEISAKDGAVSGLALTELDQAIARGVAAADVDSLMARSFAAGSTTHLIEAKGRWRLADGVLRTDDTRATLEGATARLTGAYRLDLRHLELRAEIRPERTPGAPAMIVKLTGPAEDPDVDIDAVAFKSFLARQAVP